MGSEYYYADDSFGVIGGAEAGAVGFIGAFVLIYGFVMLLALAFSVATYVLHSLGLYTVARRRKLRKPWLAWIPVGNVWLLGSISDQYQYMAKGKTTGRRKIMLGLSIAAVANYFVWLLATAFSAATGIGGVGTVLLVLLGILALFAVAIALVVFEYMCYYDLYRSCDPDNSALFLALSIVFTAVMPFFVFACRKKDKGMPVRKQPVATAVIPAETAEPRKTEEAEEKAEAEAEGESEDGQEIPVADA